MDSPLVIILLRALHILGGVFWVGSIILLARFVVPASRKTDGGAILGHLFKDRRLGLALAAAGTTNIVTGMLLYSKFYAAQRWNFASPGPTEAFGLGGVLALAALIIGVTYGVWMARTLSGEAPGSETAEIGARRAAHVAVLTRVQMVLLIAATLLMATARYL